MEDRIREFQGSDQLDLFPYAVPRPKWRWAPAIILTIVALMMITTA